MNKIIIITGLTCSGKSDLAIEIAKKLKQKKLSITEIAEITGLTKEEVEKL